MEERRLLDAIIEATGLLEQQQADPQRPDTQKTEAGALRGLLRQKGFFSTPSVSQSPKITPKGPDAFERALAANKKRSEDQSARKKDRSTNPTEKTRARFAQSDLRLKWLKKLGETMKKFGMR